MLLSTRRALVVIGILGLGLLGTLSFQSSAAAQRDVIIKQPIPPNGQPGRRPRPNPNPPRRAPGEMFSSLQLRVKDDLKLAIRAVQEHIDVGEWPEAIDKLQRLLARDDGSFAPVQHVAADGTRQTVKANVRVVANRLISKLPKEGLDFYKVEFGPKAAAMLKTAKESGNHEVLADVMRLYLYTDAGAEATDLLGTYHLDRGNYTQAALCFERLLLSKRIEDVEAKVLFKAAVAFKRDGNKKLEEQVWKQLRSRGDDVWFGKKRIEIAKLEQWTAQLKSSAFDVAKTSWIMFEGSPTRTGQGRGGTAYLEHDWRVETFRNPSTQTNVRQIISDLNNVDQAVLPAAFPIATTINYDDNGEIKKLPLVIYRSNFGVHAHVAEDVPGFRKGEMLWQTILFQWGMDGMVPFVDPDDPTIGSGSPPGATTDLTQWINQYRNSRMHHLILENSVVGSLSTDNKRVFALDDFTVTPYVTPAQPNPQFRSPEVRRALGANKLQAFEIDTGKLKWMVGGSSATPLYKGNALTDHVFLGPPLPMGGKLYVLAEKKEFIFLVTLDPETGTVLGDPMNLAGTEEAVTRNVHRRFNACHLAYGDGIMVCPTNAGGILGVDLMTRDLIWMYEYRERGEQTNPVGGTVNQPGIGFQPRPGGQPGTGIGSTPPSTWKTSAPIIQAGKVIVAPPDGSSVHCFNLRDGSPAWRQPRSSDDLYLAGVFKGNVLIVGEKTVRALNLKDGTVAWSVETGMPSGRGVASDDVYYLPLRKGKASGLPEICAIDVERGRVRGHTIAKVDKPGAVNAKPPIVPGNLLFFKDQVISQSALHVTAYPQLSLRIKSLDALVKKNPKDTAILTERGKLRLYNGQLSEAIDDLRTALANKPPAEVSTKARSLLYESFTEHFQREFNRAEKHLDEYYAMCKVVEKGMTGAELAQAQSMEKERLRNYYSLLGKGREEQRKFADAYRAYVSLLKLDEKDREEMLTVIDEPHVRADPFVWARGRIEAMVAKSTVEEREPLEKLIQEELEAVSKKGTLIELKQFVRLFGSKLRGGRQARVELAKRLMNQSDTGSMIEAEQHLGILAAEKSDPQMNAQAVEMLAKLMIKREMMEAAAFYYGILGAEHAKTVVRDGKTGLSIYRELPTDRRLMLHLHVAEPTIDAKDIEVKHAFTGSSVFPSGEHRLMLAGESLPFFRRHKLLIRSYQEFQIVDRLDNKVYWSFRMKTNAFNGIGNYRGYNPPIDPKHVFYNVGHLVVIKAGFLVYGLDVINKKILWEKDLSVPRATYYQQHQVRPDGSVVVIYQDGWKQEFGSDRLLSAKVVCLQTRESLEALNPITGKKLWSRSDLGKLCHLYNDSHHIFAVEMNNDAPGRTRVFRAEDGVEVRVRDFSNLYAKRLRMLGSKLIVADEDTGARKVIRQYNVLKGTDDWKHTFTIDAKFLQSEAEDFVGVADQKTGDVTIVDVRTGKVALKSRVDDPAHLKDLMSIHLLQDRNSLFLACRGNDNPLATNQLMSNFMPNSGRRAIPINGHVYCFDRATGKRRWFYRPTMEDPSGGDTKEWKAVPAMLVVQQFDELPAVILTSRYTVRQGNQNVYQVDTRVINKMTGKLEFGPKTSTTQSNQFHTLRIDANANRVDLISYNETISLLLNGATDDGSATSLPGRSMEGAGQPSTSPNPFGQPVPGIRIQQGVIRGGRRR